MDIFYLLIVVFHNKDISYQVIVYEGHSSMKAYRVFPEVRIIQLDIYWLILEKRFQKIRSRFHINLLPLFIRFEIVSGYYFSTFRLLNVTFLNQILQKTNYKYFIFPNDSKIIVFFLNSWNVWSCGTYFTCCSIFSACVDF